LLIAAWRLWRLRPERRDAIDETPIRRRRRFSP